MKNKVTDELFNEIIKTSDINTYINENASELIGIEFHQYLDELFSNQALTKAEVIEKSNIDKTYAYHIFSGGKMPSRNKVIALGFGLSLPVEAFQKLLQYSGNRELYARDKRDSVILFAVANKLSVIECNIALYELGLAELG